MASLLSEELSIRELLETVFITPVPPSVMDILGGLTAGGYGYILNLKVT